MITTIAGITICGSWGIMCYMIGRYHAAKVRAQREARRPQNYALVAYKTAGKTRFAKLPTCQVSIDGEITQLPQN